MHRTAKPLPLEHIHLTDDGYAGATSERPPSDPIFCFPGPYLRDIPFAVASATLEEHANVPLDNAVELLRKAIAIRVLIVGYTDSTGSPAANRRLALRRARAVRDHLVAHGIDGERLHAISATDTQVLGAGRDEESLARNRRVHFVAYGPDTDLRQIAAVASGAPASPQGP